MLGGESGSFVKWLNATMFRVSERTDPKLNS